MRASEAHALGPLKRHGFTTEDYRRFAGRVLAAAEKPVPARELERLVGLTGAELGTVLRCLRYEGRLLTLAGESLNMSPHRYVATSSWLPGGLEASATDEARVWLAGEYLRAYGPARIEDFTWWSGLPKRAATAAMGSHDTVDVGDGLLLHRSDERSFADVEALRNAVAVLPRWDSYTMGHAPDGRERFVHPDVQDEVYTPIGTGLPGDGNPVVLVDGEVVALWTFTQKTGPELRPLDTIALRTRKRIDERLQEVAGLLG